MIAVSLVGWLAASGAGVVAGGAWRALTGRMETVARACHELRGPITAARLGLQLGARSGELSPARMRAIDLELGRAALALEDLDGVRARGLMTAWRPLEPVDLGELVADSVEAWRPAAVARSVELTGSWSGPPARVWGDRLRIAQATGNLIANAIEHGGGVVEVRGSVDALDGRGSADAARARVEITDTGPGLPAPVAELARRPRAGRGVRGRGLAIASAVASSHGGRLTAAPSGRGARLVLELPTVAGDAGSSAEAGTEL
ncbi:MAG: sensor histidine kinase [Solirubrobacteraceae bacterium]